MHSRLKHPLASHPSSFAQHVTIRTCFALEVQCSSEPAADPGDAV